MHGPWLALSLLASSHASAPAGDEDSAAAVAEIFDESCSYCHDESDDLPLTGDPSSLLGREGATGVPLVVPGDARGSYLIQKIIGAEGIDGDPMPMGEDPLPPEQIAAVQGWIEGLVEDERGEPKEPGSSTEPEEQDPSLGPLGDPTGEEEQEGDEPEDPEPLVAAAPRPKPPFFGTHQVNAQTVTTLGAKTLSFRVHHRFGRVGALERTYLGLAGGASMSLGVGYGIIDGLDLLLRWGSVNLGWELGAKYVPLRQEKGDPVSFGVYASGEALHAREVANRFSGSVSAMVGRLWVERLGTQLMVNFSGPTNHSTTPTVDLGDGEGPRAIEDKRGTLGVGVLSTVWLGKKKKHGIDFEYLLPLPIPGQAAPFYYNGGDSNPSGTKAGSYALGWSTRQGLHLFQVFVTNTRAIHTNLVAPGGDFGNPFSPFGDFYLGFNLTRKWKL